MALCGLTVYALLVFNNFAVYVCTHSFLPTHFIEGYFGFFKFFEIMKSSCNIPCWFLCGHKFSNQ